GEVGVGDLADLRLEELPVLEHPVVLDVAVGAPGDHVLHAGARARAVRLALGELLAFVEPLLGEVLGHLAVLPWSWCADHRAASSPVLLGVGPADADLLAVPVAVARSAPRFARVRDVTCGEAA